MQAVQKVEVEHVQTILLEFKALALDLDQARFPEIFEKRVCQDIHA